MGLRARTFGLTPPPLRLLPSLPPAATYDLREHMNASAEPVPYGTDEFDLTGLTKAAGSVVCAPRVAESPVAFECRYHSTLTLPGNESDEGAYVVIGQVVGVHISEDVLTDGMIDMRKTRPIARVGYGGVRPPPRLPCVTAPARLARSYPRLTFLAVLRALQYAVLDESFEMIIPGTRGRPSSLPAAVAPVDGPTPSGP